MLPPTDSSGGGGAGVGGAGEQKNVSVKSSVGEVLSRNVNVLIKVSVMPGVKDMHPIFQ